MIHAYGEHAAERSTPGGIDIIVAEGREYTWNENMIIAHALHYAAGKTAYHFRCLYTIEPNPFAEQRNTLPQTHKDLWRAMST